ncbi:hypothetical protein HDV00_005574 [Rhizophlyctis rosea]|nr:hypothetical protein HDV00_005574 [Rhizophlyctis rosea]
MLVSTLAWQAVGRFLLARVLGENDRFDIRELAIAHHSATTLPDSLNWLLLSEGPKSIRWLLLFLTLNTITIAIYQAFLPYTVTPLNVFTNITTSSIYKIPVPDRTYFADMGIQLWRNLSDPAASYHPEHYGIRMEAHRSFWGADLGDRYLLAGTQPEVDIAMGMLAFEQGVVDNTQVLAPNGWTFTTPEDRNFGPRSAGWHPAVRFDPSFVGFEILGGTQSVPTSLSKWSAPATSTFVEDMWSDLDRSTMTIDDTILNCYTSMYSYNATPAPCQYNTVRMDIIQEMPALYYQVSNAALRPLFEHYFTFQVFNLSADDPTSFNGKWYHLVFDLHMTPVWLNPAQDPSTGKMLLTESAWSANPANHANLTFYNNLIAWAQATHVMNSYYTYNTLTRPPPILRMLLNQAKTLQPQYHNYSIADLFSDTHHFMIQQTRYAHTGLMVTIDGYNYTLTYGSMTETSLINYLGISAYVFALLMFVMLLAACTISLRIMLSIHHQTAAEVGRSKQKAGFRTWEIIDTVMRSIEGLMYLFKHGMDKPERLVKHLSKPELLGSKLKSVDKMSLSTGKSGAVKGEEVSHPVVTRTQEAEGDV